MIEEPPLDAAVAFRAAPPRTSFSVPEFAEANGISEKTVRRLIRKGVLRTLRLGRALRIPTSEVERLSIPKAP